MAKKPINLGALTAGAALQETSAKPATSKPIAAKPATKSKNIPALPLVLEERFAALRAEGKTLLPFTGYIIEALREKLERDESR